MMTHTASRTQGHLEYRTRVTSSNLLSQFASAVCVENYRDTFRVDTPVTQEQYVTYA